MVRKGAAALYKDEELVSKSQNGDIYAFEELVCRYERKIYTAAYRLIGNPDDASDIAQEAFLRAFQSIRNFRNEASFLTWMYRITTNLCRDELRKRYRVSYTSLDEKITLPDGEVSRQTASSEPDPALLYERKELQEKIGKLIAALSPEFRLALVMRDIQGFSYDEIAEQLGCSLGTVKSRINRARRHLQKKLAAELEQNGEPQRLKA